MADRVILAGVPFISAARRDVAHWIRSHVRGTGACQIVIPATVGLIARAARDRELASILHHSAVVTAAETPILWLSRLVGKALPERITGADLIDELAGLSTAEKLRVYLLARTDDSDRLAHAMMQRFPTLEFAGWEGLSATHLQSADGAEWAERIRRSRADLLLVALGSPDLERWIVRHAAALPARVCVALHLPAESLMADSAELPARTIMYHAQVSPRPPSGSRSRLKQYVIDLMQFCPLVLRQYLHGMGWDRAPLTTVSPHVRIPLDAILQDVNADSDSVPPLIGPPPSGSAPYRRHRHLVRQVGLCVADAATFDVMFLIADVLRCIFRQRTGWPQPPIASYQGRYWYLWVVPILMAAWPAILASLGLYQTLVPPPTWRWRRAAIAGFVLLLFYSALALFFARLEYPRMLILLTSGAAPLGFLAGRFAIDALSRARRWFNSLGLPDYTSY